MTDAILLAYNDVERSMERFTELLHSHVETMGAAPSHDADQVFRLSQGSKAMRDSAMIYLSTLSTWPMACRRVRTWCKTSCKGRRMSVWFVWSIWSVLFTR